MVWNIVLSFKGKFIDQRELTNNVLQNLTVDKIMQQRLNTKIYVIYKFISLFIFLLHTFSA